jgi:hypothetical protein
MHGILLILDRAAYAQIPWLCEQDCVSKRRERAGEKVGARIIIRKCGRRLGL